MKNYLTLIAKFFGCTRADALIFLDENQRNSLAVEAMLADAYIIEITPLTLHAETPRRTPTLFGVGGVPS